jgi:hypothetical protein
VALAFYPQLILKRTDPTVEQTVAKVTGGEATKAQLASMSLEEKRELESGNLELVP